MEYQNSKKIKCDKLVLMHFEDNELYKLAQKDGFNVAQISVAEQIFLFIYNYNFKKGRQEMNIDLKSIQEKAKSGDGLCS